MTNMREPVFEEGVLNGGRATEYFCSTYLLSHFMRDVMDEAVPLC